MVKIAIFGLTHRLKHRITRKLLNRPIDRYTVADPRGGAHPAPPPPYFRKGKKKFKNVSFANSEGGPKRVKSDSCEAQSCFPGYRIIETTAILAATCLNPSRTSSSLGHTMYRRRRTQLDQS